jgi:hypothetical protein
MGVGAIRKSDVNRHGFGSNYRCGTPSQSVVGAVAAETGADPLTMDPLYEVFDPDALDALSGDGKSGSGSSSTRVEFTYAGCRVCVRGDGALQVEGIAD